jgi:hypothetical protein
MAMASGAMPMSMMMARNETVDHVEVVFENAIERHRRGRRHGDAGLGIRRAGEGGEAICQSSAAKRSRRKGRSSQSA